METHLDTLHQPVLCFLQGGRLLVLLKFECHISPKGLPVLISTIPRESRILLSQTF
jgi:hypothetical protein